VYLDRTYQGNVRGLAEEHQLEVRINGERIETFTVGGGAEGSRTPSATRSATSADPQGSATSATNPRPPAPSGRVRLTPEQIADRAADIVQQAQVSGQRAEQDHSADAHLFVSVRAKAGPATIAVSFVADDALHEGMRRPTLMITSYEYAGNTVGNPLVASIDIRGPYNATGRGDTPSRRRIFQCRPAGGDGTACATQIISRLARQAYRRPVTRDDLAPLLDFFQQGQRGRDFDAGIQAAIERMLVSPSFLFRT